VPNNKIARCKCGFLERHAGEPDSPIRFDAQMNEYHFVYPGSMGGEARMNIYHCPFCGGRAPKSRRGDLFAVTGQLKTSQSGSIQNRPR
jgi:hypothetical protein